MCGGPIEFLDLHNEYVLCLDCVHEMGLSVPEQPVKKWMDGCYLHAGRHPDTPAPFFSELYEELTRS